MIFLRSMRLLRYRIFFVEFNNVQRNTISIMLTSLGITTILLKRERVVSMQTPVRARYRKYIHRSRVKCTRDGSQYILRFIIPARVQRREFGLAAARY